MGENMGKAKHGGTKWIKKVGPMDLLLATSFDQKNTMKLMKNLVLHNLILRNSFF